MSESEKDHITLKWGTLKAWELKSESAIAAANKYFETPQSAGCMTQRDTPEQKQLLCDLIDAANLETVHLDWDGIDVSKEDAKKYVMEYNT